MKTMAQKNKKKQDVQDVHTLINQMEKTPYTANLVNEIEQDEVNQRDSGIKDNRQ
jgi:prophage antirepressor-like protein